VLCSLTIKSHSECASSSCATLKLHPWRISTPGQKRLLVILSQIYRSDEIKQIIPDVWSGPETVTITLARDDKPVLNETVQPVYEETRHECLICAGATVELVTSQ